MGTGGAACTTCAQGTAVSHLPYWERWLDHVGAQGVDVALVPEGFNGCGGARTMECVQPLLGPSGRLLQRMAKKWSVRARPGALRRLIISALPYNPPYNLHINKNREA